MTITWYGYSCFRIDTREAVLAIDPFSKDIGLTPPRFRADIMLITHGHPAHANTQTIPGEPVIIDGPGEYEAKGVSVTGIPTFHDNQQGLKRGQNTVFVINAEGMTIAHLGDFGEAAIREETLDAIGDIDILMIPVGGAHTIGADAAAATIAKIEPRLVIPMHYHLPGLKVKLAPVEDFLKSAGATSAERLEKFSARRKDLPETETRVIVLAPN